jgi:predicted CXXCH cytochrome family protein
MKMIKTTILFALLSFAGSVWSQTIVRTAHDFSTASWNTGGEICIVCHASHNADATITNAPLWNHKSTVAAFTTYSSATMNATTGQPDASSKLCLSCHDGTVAVDNFGGKTNGTYFLTSTSNMGTNLSNDHPISFTYSTALALTDGGLYDPMTTNSGLGNTINADLLLGGKVQCASCHDVHNSAVGTKHLLVKSNNASSLCLTCHKK